MIAVVQLGTPRKPNEGPRIGTVRRPPRGVKKSDFARLNFYDVWFPNFSPSAELVKEALAAKNERELAIFRRKFRTEMNHPDRSRELDVLAALSHHSNFSLGCYCADEHRCHRVRAARTAQRARRECGLTQPSFKISRAALNPGAPITPPPGCAPDSAQIQPAHRRAYRAQPATGRMTNI